MDKLNVLHIMSGYGGGISSFIFNKAKEMAQYDIRFDVVTYDDCPEDFKEAIHSTGGTIYTMVNPKTNGWRNFISSFTAPLKQNQYDVIHCHIAGIRVIPYYLFSKRYSKAKFYLHAHSSVIVDNLNATEKLKLKTDQMINDFTSELPLGCGEKSIRSIYGPSISKNEMMVVPNSIDLDEFVFRTSDERFEMRKKHREKLDLKDNELVVGHVGRLTTVKNHEQTLRLGRYIKENRLPWKVLIIGEGDRQQELIKEVKDEDLNGCVVFTGRISPISEFYPALDALFLPSFSEGLPTVVVESQIAGVPVVMSDTITKEVDLGFNMIESVPLNEDISVWAEAVQRAHLKDIPSTVERKSRADIMNFSNVNSAMLYADFLRGKISNYTISSFEEN